VANMAYCRFQNTLRDLQDCDQHMADGDLSAEEEKARKALIAVCCKVAEDCGEDADDDA